MMQQGKGLGQLTLPEGCGGVLEGPGPVLVLKEGLDLEGEEGGREYARKWGWLHRGQQELVMLGSCGSGVQLAWVQGSGD